MRKFILPFVLLLCFLPSVAQESKWGVSFTPALVVSPKINIGIQPGVEYRINHRLSLLTEIAFTTAKDKDSSYMNTKYFRIKPELRYMLSASDRRIKFYTGLQLSYSFRKWDDLSGGCYFNKEFYSDSTVGYNRASVKSPVFTSSLQFGALLSLSDHMYFDFFAGVGARVISTNYSNVENAVKQPYFRPICKIVPAPDPAHWVNGVVTRFHSTIGVRLLYRF